MFLGLRKGLKRMDEFISTSPVEKHLVIRQFHLSQRNLMKQLTGNMATLTVQEHNSQNFTLDKRKCIKMKKNPATLFVQIN